MNDSFKLLYNNLWKVNKLRVNKLNPDYILPNDEVVLIDNHQTTVAALVKPSITPPKYIPKVEVAEKVVAKVESQSTTKALIANELILDWDRLVTTVKNCDLCNLCSSRQNVVIERGNRHAPWMFVGDGPGEEEDNAGIPFIGNKGQLLDKMIAAMKLDKDRDVYISNIVKCRIPSNRNPDDNEIAMCKNYLLSQIELVKPQIIIALGRFASQTLLNSGAAIEKLRGKVHKFNNIPLIVTYDPTYLLRNVDAKKDAWDDLQLAMKVKG